MEKRERRTNIIFPIILRLLVKILSWDKWKVFEISGKKIRFKKMEVGKNIKLKETLYSPEFKLGSII